MAIYIGGDFVTGQIYNMDGVPQGSPIYGETDEEVIAKAKAWLEEQKRKLPGDLYDRLYGRGVDVRIR